MEGYRALTKYTIELDDEWSYKLQLSALVQNQSLCGEIKRILKIHLSQRVLTPATKEAKVKPEPRKPDQPKKRKPKHDSRPKNPRHSQRAPVGYRRRERDPEDD